MHPCIYRYTCQPQVHVDVHIFHATLGCCNAMPCRSLLQRAKREQYVNKILRKLKRVLEADGDHVRRMVSTNRLFPLGSFKSRAVADLFGGWAAKFRGQGRCMTKKLAMLVCQRLRASFDLEPGTKEEAERFLHLLQAARKKDFRNQPGKKLPWTLARPSHWIFARTG